MMPSKLQVAGSIAAGALTLSALAPLSFAADTTTPDPTSCANALTADTTAELSAMDTLNAAKKADLQTRTNAMTIALALPDTTTRTTAIQAAFKAQMTTDQAAMKTFNDATKTTRDAVRTACQGLLNGTENAGMMGMMGKAKGVPSLGVKAMKNGKIKTMMTHKKGKAGAASSSTNASAQ